MPHWKLLMHGWITARSNVGASTETIILQRRRRCYVKWRKSIKKVGAKDLSKNNSVSRWSG